MQPEKTPTTLAGAGRKTWSMFVGNVPNILAVAFLFALLLHFLPVQRLAGLVGEGCWSMGLSGR